MGMSCQRRERPGKTRGGWAVGVLEGSKAAAEGSIASRAAAMAQLKTAGDLARDTRVCGDLFSDMATVTSSAGESKNPRVISTCFRNVHTEDQNATMCLRCEHATRGT